MTDEQQDDERRDDGGSWLLRHPPVRSPLDLEMLRRAAATVFLAVCAFAIVAWALVCEWR